MKKKLKITFNVIFIGTFIGFWINVFFCFILKLNSFQVATPIFLSSKTSNLFQTIVAAIIWGLMGVVFSLASVVFQKETWSITRQTVFHFIITYVLFSALSILAGWFHMNPYYFISFTIVFIIIYLIIWWIEMLKAKETIKQINAELKS